MSGGFMKSLAIAAIHVAIVGSLGAKYLIDRTTLPRVWVRSAPVDPNAPIRGRYVRLRLEVDAPDSLLPQIPAPVQTDALTFTPPPRPVEVTLEVRGTQLVAVPARSRNTAWLSAIERDGRRVGALQQPVAFFIPENIPDPSVRQPGEELWVEVTVPRKGLPRPIRLGVKKDGVLTPLELK
jgi:hypothetical protein